MHENRDFRYLPAPPSVITAVVSRTFAIGKFDGLHLAHQAVLRMAVEKARGTDSIPCLFSFTPHPRYALTGDRAFERWLTPPHMRAEWAKQYGMHEVYLAEFTSSFREQSAQAFMDHYLVPLGARHLVVGHDFRLGKGGAYGPEDLRVMGLTRGITVDEISQLQDDGQTVSSSWIRSLLADGDMVTAQRLLGRPYALRGKVVPGQQVGRTIGFATANLELTELFVLPREGVYVVDCALNGRIIRGVMNIGRRPTVDATRQLTLEVHLLDFADDLYDQILTVDLRYYLRSEQKFASLDELIAQLKLDVHAARVYESL